MYASLQSECHRGLTAESRTSVQQGFASDVLVSIAAYIQPLLHLPYILYSNQIYLQNTKCIVIIILMAQASIIHITRSSV